MNIALCDDNEIILNHLAALVKEIITQHNIYHFDFDYFCYTDSQQLLQDNKNKRFDVVFLDIEMPKGSGLDIGDEMFNYNENIFIFYVTSYNSYIAESIKHRVYRFIDKQDLTTLHEGIKSMLYDLSARNTRYTFAYKGSNYSIPIMSINYFEHYRNTVKIITDKEILLQRTTIKKLVAILPKMFQQCHAAFIVNTLKVKEINNKNVMLINNSIIPVSRRYRQELLFKVLIDFNDSSDK